MSWPAEELEHVGACPVCRSKERSLRHADISDVVYRKAPGTWRLYRCHQCQACYIDPRPTPTSIGKAYSDFYTHNAAPPSSASLLRRFNRAIRNGYINHRVKGALRPSTLLGAWLVPFFPSKRREMDFSLRCLPEIGKDKTVLDVGSGNGDFLEFAATLGWNVRGVEPDATAAALAQSRGLRIDVGRFEEIDLPAASFDAITLCHVIEHFHDPVEVLAKAARLLKPGGLLWMATPNTDSAGHLRFGKSWIGLDSPRHLVLFNSRSLLEALKRSGFEGNHRFLSGRSSRGDFLLSWKAANGLRPFEPHAIRFPMRLRIEAYLADLRNYRLPRTEGEIIFLGKKQA